MAQRPENSEENSSAARLYAKELAQGKQALRALGEPELIPVLQVFAGLETDFGNPDMLVGTNRNRGSYQGIFQFGPARLKDLSAVYRNLAPQLADSVSADVRAYLLHPPTSAAGIAPYKGQGVAAALQIHQYAARFEQETGAPLASYGAMGAYAYHLLGTSGGSRLIQAYRNDPDKHQDGMISAAAFSNNLTNEKDPYGHMMDLNPERWKHESITSAQAMELLHRKAGAAYLRLKEKPETTEQQLAQFRKAVWPGRSADYVEAYVTQIPKFRETGDIMRHAAYVADAPHVLKDSPLPLSPSTRSLPPRDLSGAVVADHDYPPPSQDAQLLSQMARGKAIVQIPLLETSGAVTTGLVHLHNVPSPYQEHPRTRQLQEALNALGEPVPLDGKLGEKTAAKAIQAYTKTSGKKLIVPTLPDPDSRFDEKARRPEIWLVSSDLMNTMAHEGTIVPALLRKVRTQAVALATQESLTPDEWKKLRHGLHALGYLDERDIPSGKGAPAARQAIKKLLESKKSDTVSDIRYDSGFEGTGEASLPPDATPPAPRTPGGHRLG